MEIARNPTSAHRAPDAPWRRPLAPCVPPAKPPIGRESRRSHAAVHPPAPDTLDMRHRVQPEHCDEVAGHQFEGGAQCKSIIRITPCASWTGRNPGGGRGVPASACTYASSAGPRFSARDTRASMARTGGYRAPAPGICNRSGPRRQGWPVHPDAGRASFGVCPRRGRRSQGRSPPGGPSGKRQVRSGVPRRSSAREAVGRPVQDSSLWKCALMLGPRKRGQHIGAVDLRNDLQCFVPFFASCENS